MMDTGKTYHDSEGRVVDENVQVAALKWYADKVCWMNYLAERPHRAAEMKRVESELRADGGSRAQHALAHKQKNDP